MKKKSKISVILIFALIMCINTTVLAESMERYIDGSLLLDMPVSEVSTDIQQKGNILDQATIRLSDNENDGAEIFQWYMVQCKDIF